MIFFPPYMLNVTERKKTPSPWENEAANGILKPPKPKGLLSHWAGASAGGCRVV